MKILKKSSLYIVSFVAMFFLLGTTCSVKASEREILHEGKTGDINWSIDSEGLLIIEGEGDFEYEWSLGFCNDKEGIEHELFDIVKPWMEYKDEILSAKVSVKKVKSLRSFFSRCENLKKIEFVDCDTSNVNDMSNMFHGTGAECIDISTLDTSNVIDFSGMFSSCKAKEINLTGINTLNVTDISRMFFNAVMLENIYGIEELDFTNVTKLLSVFEKCSSIKELDLKKWNISKINSLQYAFAFCENLEKLDISTWDVQHVEEFYAMCAEDFELQYIDLSKWDTKNAVDIESMFYWCGKLSGAIRFTGDKIQKYAHSFYAVGVKVNKTFQIIYDGDCTYELIKPIYEVNGYIDENYQLVDANGKVILPAPTATPTEAPTVAPTEAPTVAPTATPTIAPTVAPTATTTVAPTVTPTVAPTVKPTVTPTVAPTITPEPTSSATPTTTPTIKLGKVGSLKVKNNKKKIITVSFKKVANAKTYYIEYATDKKFKKSVKKKTVIKLSNVIKGMKKGKTYYVRVRAKNGTVAGAWSKVMKVKIKK